MLDPREAIDRLTAAYRGPHPGHRTLHSRGTFYEGTFTASADAAELCRAVVFSGERAPVLVRWSNAAGSPRLPDKAPDVRGMAEEVRRAGGGTGPLGETGPPLPGRPPAGVVSLTPGAPRPAAVPPRGAAHPRGPRAPPG